MTVTRLEDGFYLTHAHFTPNTVNNQRVVQVVDNYVSLINPKSVHKFTVPFFFEVNILIEKLEHYP